MVGTGSGTFTRSPALNASCLTVVCSLALAVPLPLPSFSSPPPHRTTLCACNSSHYINTWVLR